MKSIKNYKPLIIYIIGICAMLFIFVFLLSVTIIGYSVKNTCQIAQQEHEGDCVEALNQYLDDESNGFKARNRAIWAIGQLGDERSRNVLEKYYTGYDGERSNRSEELAQLELERAIGYLDGNWNITTFFWRFDKNL